MANDLGLVGDGDELDLIVDVEAAFAVAFEDTELELMLTVGQMYDALLNRIGSKDRQAELCFSVLVFYRLRRALMPFMSGERLGPKSLINSRLSAKYPDRIVAQLENETDFTLPGLVMGVPQWLGCLVMLSIFFLPGAARALTPWPSFIGYLAIPFVLAAGFMLVKLKRGSRFSADYADLGTLTRKVVALNYGKLLQEHGYPGDDDLWSAFVAIIEDHSAIPKLDINRETRFIPA